MSNQQKENPNSLSRRVFLQGATIKAAEVGIALAIPTWLAAACDFRPKSTLTPVQEKTGTPNLDLKIDESSFWSVVKGGSRFTILPEATDKSKLQLLSPNIYAGKDSNLFRVGLNQPMADFIFRQAKLFSPSLRTNIVFVEDWGQGDMISGEGGYTAITKDETEQNVIIWLKRAAWHAFKATDQQRLSVQDYYQGVLSFYASVWTMHELGHAGAETKVLWRKGQSTSPEQYEAVHPQIFTFQKEYEKLYDQAGKQGLAANALLIGIEPAIDLNRLRSQISQEAKQRGFE